MFTILRKRVSKILISIIFLFDNWFHFRYYFEIFFSFFQYFINYFIFWGKEKSL